MATDALYCKRHPSVETGLRCGRCDTPICPKCAVFTDVGARCPDCAPRRKLPQFEVGPVYALRGGLAGIVAGTVVGGLWGLLLPGGFGFFSIFLGIGIGSAVAESVGLATNRKSGPVIQATALLGIVIAYLTRNVVAGYPMVPVDDWSGLIVLIAAVATAIGRSRI
jgi:hypothetical protein